MLRIYIASASPAVPCARSSRLGMAAINLAPSPLGLPSGFNGRSKKTPRGESSSSSSLQKTVHVVYVLLRPSSLGIMYYVCVYIYIYVCVCNAM